LEYFFPVGSAVWAKVVRMREDERRRGEWLVSLDASVVDQETGIDLDPIGAKMDAKKFVDRRGDRRDGPRFSGDGRDGDRERDGPPVSHPELHKVYKARVARIKAVGVFVDIKGFRRGGLVHRTQISQYLDVPRDTEDEEKEAIISGIVAEGDEVYVKVVDVEKVDGAPPRVSLSMKSVDQGNGEDLDPNNLSYDPPFRGGGRGEQSYRPVGADAGETVKAGAIKWGHHVGDVKQYGSGGKSYDLLLG
jgi:predicted RNA-binding protein with RPS1 domain